MSERCVTDYPPRGAGTADASNIIYDDSQTHLNADNVQTAIEKTNLKVDANTETINSQYEMINNKQNKLIAGDNILIINNVISAQANVVTTYDSLNENLKF